MGASWYSKKEIEDGLDDIDKVLSMWNVEGGVTGNHPFDKSLVEVDLSKLKKLEKLLQKEWERRESEIKTSWYASSRIIAFGE